jgi:hypothetical protein
VAGNAGLVSERHGAGAGMVIVVDNAADSLPYRAICYGHAVVVKNGSYHFATPCTYRSCQSNKEHTNVHHNLAQNTTRG